jgi:hypothetical protein
MAVKMASKPVPRKAASPISDLSTWGVRAVLIGMGSLILWEVRSVQQMHEDVAVVKIVVDSHSKQIQEIWERFRK